MRRLFFVFLLLTILHIAHTSCPDGFELVADGECRGLYASMRINWEQAAPTAIAKCKEIEAQPVIIHNEEQNNYWTDRFRSGNYLILGIVCNTKTSRWEWADGSAIDYKPAAGYNPDLNGNCKSGCVWDIYSSAVPGYWYYWCTTGSYTFDIFCTTQLPPLPVPSADRCATFDDDSDDGVCYKVVITAEDWQEAQTICRSFGAVVASIHNQQENSFVRRLAVSKGAVGGLYLGATLSGKGNEFGWMDGSEWDYDNFYPGFPMNGMGSCLVMDTEGTSGQWVNVDCSSKLSVACMREQHYTQPGCSSGPWTEGQIIYSPGFPFDASTPCDFMISVDTGKKVELELLLLEANSCCDHLTLVDNYFGGNLIANLTGEISDKKYTSSTNFMRVSWQPNGGVNVRGVMMTFRGV